MLPKHGKLSCRNCFGLVSGDTCQPHSEWMMINDPCSWGSPEPEYLVLGFSKGATQVGAFRHGVHEDVAFAGMRPRLEKALKAVGVLGHDEKVDDKIADPESNVAFGSLIRCSVSRIDSKASLRSGEAVYGCTGPLIGKSFDEIPHVITSCTKTFLSALPKRTKAVVFLGNSDKYVRETKKVIRSLYHDSYAEINDMAVRADQRVWAFLAHPSGLNGHFFDWLESDQGSGLKRIQAEFALSAIVGAEAKPFVSIRKDKNVEEISDPKSRNVYEPVKAASTLGNAFSKAFYMVHESGDRLYPVRMKNRDTGQLAFRVSKGGNTKSDSIEVEGEELLKDYVIKKKYAVRAATLNRSRNGLFRVGQRSIREVVC